MARRYSQALPEAGLSANARLFANASWVARLIACLLAIRRSYFVLCEDLILCYVEVLFCRMRRF